MREQSQANDKKNRKIQKFNYFLNAKKLMKSS